MREDGSEILEGICNYSVVWQRDNDMERKERFVRERLGV